jgi:nucleoside-diphosphate-sugar epimerase
MTFHVIVGAGPVGTAIAARLTSAGHRVRVITRTPRRDSLGGIEHVAADASDPAVLAELTSGAAVLYNAANPRGYHQWTSVWPPLSASLLAAAETSGAVLATVGNLYPYGPVDGPMHEGLPDAAAYTNGRVRAQMWAEARRAHEEGRVRAVEVRASDYIGAGAYSHISVAAKQVASGKRTVRVVGDPHQPHSWTGTGDTAELLIAAAADESALGRTWIVPSNPPRSQAQAAADVAAALGKPAPRVVGMGRGLLRAVGLVQPPMRPMRDVYYQFDRPFVVDDSSARRHFALDPTPWDRLVAETASSAG